MPEPLKVPVGYQPLVNPEGDLVYSPIANVKDNIQLYQYRPATSEDLSKAALKKQYGEGFGNELAAGVEGAVSGATFGISRHVENILGIATPEAQAARKEFNPTASTVGELGGIGASLFLAPGASLPGLVSKGAVGAGERIAAGVAENAIARQIAARTVAGGLEGLAYGASQPISEKALGDPTITAQKVFHQIGLGGLIGGGIGAVSSALGLGAKRLFSKPIATAPQDVLEGTATGTLEGEGAIKPQGPIKMEGTIDFGMPDEKILQRAESLNPKSPLKQNDLNWLKKNGLPDAEGKPTIFQKIGTPEVPTLDPLATDQVYMGDAVKEGMKRLAAERSRLNQAADEALADTVMPKSDYIGIFRNVVNEIKASPEYGLPIGKNAVKKLDTFIKAAKDLPNELAGTEARDILQSIRNEGRIYVKGGGLKNDFVSGSLEKAQAGLDDYLKKSSDAYRKVQEEFAPFTRNSIELEDHLGWNWQRNDSDLVSDWVTNRVAKPFQSALPGTKADADLIRWFGKYAGTDFEKASKANFIFGKLNPQSAQAGQLGTWGSRVAEGFDLLKRPTELPGKAVSGIAKIALTGEMPEFVTSMRARGVQDMLLGKSSAGPGVVDSILSKIQGAGKAGSKLFDENSAFGSMLVPAGVKMQQYMDRHDTVESAHNQLDTLLALEKAQNKANKAIDSAVDGIFSGKTGKEESNYGDFLGKSTQEHADGLEKLSQDTNQLVNDPQLLMERLSQSIQGIANHAPNIATGINMTAVRALKMLSDKLTAIQPKDVKLPLDQKFIPSKMQLLSVARTLKYINSPYDVLKEIQTGRVSNEGKEVLLKVYPELYQELKGKVMNGISLAQSQGKHIPTSKRLGLSFFLGQQLDSTLKPQAIAANQAVFAMPMATQNAPNPRPSSAKHLDGATRALTPLQKIASKSP